jgi:hypothetical protein
MGQVQQRLARARSSSAVDLILTFEDRRVALSEDLVAVTLTRAGAHALRMFHLDQALIARARRLTVITDATGDNILKVVRRPRSPGDGSRSPTAPAWPRPVRPSHSLGDYCRGRT